MELTADSVAYHGLREHVLLSKGQQARIERELWSCNRCTYSAYRKYLRVARDVAAKTEKLVEEPSDITGSAKYYTLSPPFIFRGVKVVIEGSSSTVTVIAFGKLSHDILAFGNMAGDAWIVNLADGEPRVKKVMKVHDDKIAGLDWSYDNTYLMTCGYDRRVIIWEAETGMCVRRITVGGSSACCCMFHSINPNLVLVGTSPGTVEAYNSNTGVMLQRTRLSGTPFKSVVTALACSSWQLFAGDSTGHVHVLRCELNTQGLQGMVHLSRTRVCGGKDSAVGHVHFLNFCTAVRGPALLSTTLDSTLTVSRVMESGRCETHVRVTLPVAARRINTIWCPSSAALTELYVASGSEDTAVHIHNLKQGSPTPVPVVALSAHAAPIMDVSWSYDERLLASADCNGLVVIWEREPF